MRYKGSKYKEEILRALQGIQEAEEREAGIVEGVRGKPGLDKTLEHRDYLWKRKETHKVSKISVLRYCCSFA